MPGRGRREVPGRGRQGGTGPEGLQGPVEAAAVVAEAGMARSKQGVSQDSGYRVHNDSKHTPNSLSRQGTEVQAVWCCLLAGSGWW